MLHIREQHGEQQTRKLFRKAYPSNGQLRSQLSQAQTASKSCEGHVRYQDGTTTRDENLGAKHVRGKTLARAISYSSKRIR